MSWNLSSRYQVPKPKFQRSKYQVPDIKSQNLSARYWVPNPICRISSPKSLVWPLSSRYQVPKPGFQISSPESLVWLSSSRYPVQISYAAYRVLNPLAGYQVLDIKSWNPCSRYRVLKLSSQYPVLTPEFWLLSSILISRMSSPDSCVWDIKLQISSSEFGVLHPILRAEHWVLVISHTFALLIRSSGCQIRSDPIHRSIPDPLR